MVRFNVRPRFSFSEHRARVTVHFTFTERVNGCLGTGTRGPLFSDADAPCHSHRLQERADAGGSAQTQTLERSGGWTWTWTWTCRRAY